MLQEEFDRGNSQVKVSHWARCKEMHERTGFHYHCCITLTGVKKWLSVKNNVMKRHNIVLHFSDSHNQYIYAYRYVCKSDVEVVHSPGHPDLSTIGSPRTKASTSANREVSRKRKSMDIVTFNQERGGSKAKRRLTKLEVSDFIIKNHIKNLQELFAKADTRKQEGECDLATYIFSRSHKALVELITKSLLLQLLQLLWSRRKVAVWRKSVMLL